jgi:hypothetical protein
MQAIGAILAIIGFLISLTGLGVVIGVPMIIIGIIALVAPRFAYIAVISGIAAYELGAKNSSQYMTIFIVVSVVILLIHIALEHWVWKKGHNVTIKNSEVDSGDFQRFSNSGSNKASSYSKLQPVRNNESAGLFSPDGRNSYERNFEKREAELIGSPKASRLEGQSREVNISDTRECPYCMELVKVRAIKCKHCGSDIDPANIPCTQSEPIDNLSTPVDALNNRNRESQKLRVKESKTQSPGTFVTVRTKKDAITLLEFMGWEVKKRLGGTYDLKKGPETLYIVSDENLILVANNRAYDAEVTAVPGIREDGVPVVNLDTNVQSTADGMAVLEFLGWTIEEKNYGWALKKGARTFYARKDSDELINIANSERKSS